MPSYPAGMSWADKYRYAGEDWADKESAAALLEDLKSSVLSQRAAALGDMAVNRAEQIVKMLLDLANTGAVMWPSAELGEYVQSKTGIPMADMAEEADDLGDL